MACYLLDGSTNFSLAFWEHVCLKFVGLFSQNFFSLSSFYEEKRYHFNCHLTLCSQLIFGFKHKENLFQILDRMDRFSNNTSFNINTSNPGNIGFIPLYNIQSNCKQDQFQTGFLIAVRTGLETGLLFFGCK